MINRSRLHSIRSKSFNMNSPPPDPFQIYLYQPFILSKISAAGAGNQRDHERTIGNWCTCG
jgi:hypothetical protein